MNPNQNIPPSYLDQIAPVQQKGGLLDGKIRKLIAIGVILVVVVIGLSILSSAISNGRKGSLEELSLNLQITKDIVEDGRSKIKNNKLRSINSEISVLVINTQTNIAKNLEALEINEKTMSKSLIAKWSSEDVLQRLEDARLNAVYDRTYIREMNFQLSQLLTYIQKVYNSTNDTTLKTSLESSYDNLNKSYQSLASYEE